MSENEHGLPVLIYNGIGEIRLLPAVGSRRGGEGKDPVDFVLEGMLMSMKLVEKDDEKAVRLQRSGEDAIILKKK